MEHPTKKPKGSKDTNEKFAQVLSTGIGEVNGYLPYPVQGDEADLVTEVATLGYAVSAPTVSYRT